MLQALLDKKTKLKPTTTLVTHLDGKQFEESNSEIRQIPNKTQFGFIVDTKPDNVPAKIIDYLYVGSQDCCDLATLQDCKITHVLSVGIEAPIKSDEVVYCFVPCLDLPGTDLRDVLRTSVGFIDSAVKNKCNVLVHCNAGVSRSASVVIGYLILVWNYDFLCAYDVVKKARACIRPNDGFVEQLKKLSNSKVI